ncbi:MULTISPECIES: TetR/AcrR family transcriptional regulator [unclassified Streptomyces]|uniref:TetR/AcrR family transcriptional regulator n=1 Tax=unclassified Streptomyces TaxID=2593676 RepID=UPI002024574C|nr:MULTISPECIES: TetR/AcrR family transcriptional regulator [unclassified Streptomyces]WSC24331.1 TetR/AcrR family transcriptional regulator [Streptomyces sp. NBC_01766]WSV58215.1 TetR/AcrR family transcriptional regulator [Streptomyces sp. NBC_01014]
MADRARQIMAAARELLDVEGPDALSMRRIAERVGIRAPSLYKHFPDKAAVEAGLQVQGLIQLAEELEAAEAEIGGEPPLLVLSRAYRRHALANPHLYRITHGRPLARTELPEGLEDRAAMPLARAVHGDIDIARSFWAFAHGMVVLELDGRFPSGADLDAAWCTGCEAFARAIRDKTGPDIV